ncbi:uncharacterized protein LOC130622783 [Hydractinia symbiolongicarpus]|uniref:uncharacterized protein LOC130622783 n=1 Tax=Hydractinia symbiolongicarpus TaxID=13093 RepID=UPI00254AE7EE|nr:uncharacterized protein LOC130622783 [Hydractinia symbiolongicarpus]
MNKNQAGLVQNETLLQSESSKWFEHRLHRITASEFKMVSYKVENNAVKNVNKVKTAVFNICGNYKSYTSKAAKWGIENKDNARKLYVKEMKKTHKKFSVRCTGFHISLQHPFVGASPDGIAHCACHKTGLLEIKCPWTYRNLTAKEYAEKKESCLHVVNGHVELKRNHQYYFQVHCQMGVTGYRYCDFFVCTSKESFTERIPFNAAFWYIIVTKAMIFYEIVIIPELFNKTWKKAQHDLEVAEEVLNDIVNKICDVYEHCNFFPTNGVIHIFNIHILNQPFPLFLI